MDPDSPPPLLIGSEVGGYTRQRHPSSSVVFGPMSEPESSPANTPMPTMASNKSQPLQNSPINDLKWSPAGPSRVQQRFHRLIADSPTTQRPPLCHSRGPDGGNPRKSLSDLPFIPAAKTAEAHKERARSQQEAAAAMVERSSRILVQFRVEEPSAPPPADMAAVVAANAPVDRGGAPSASRSQCMPNARNLRPRRPSMDRGSAVVMMNFSIHLKKEEIEADLLSMMGSRTGIRRIRRSTKRPRVVQQALNSCFPGLWLAKITTNSYKVVPKP
ncbi:hypothetical protein SAY86_020362 [Trapa natans]|uniref:Uncharacterized protein n=1 Tax=Trapa natans TaxID=22666 RepID=A0AAN7LIW7_TRANT|nr:hypothetical protein SAY86_020362 [Trapa natans]